MTNQLTGDEERPLEPVERDPVEALVFIGRVAGRVGAAAADEVPPDLFVGVQQVGERPVVVRPDVAAVL